MKYLKQKIQLKLQVTIILMLSTLNFLSCTDNDIETIDPNRDTGLVTFSVKIPGQSLPSTYTSLTNEDENKIESIHVLVFDKDGIYTGNLLSPELLIQQGNDVIFTVRIPEGENYQVNVLANVNNLIQNKKGYFTKGATKKDIFDLLIVENHANEINFHKPMQMWGEIASLTVSNTTPAKNDVFMIRMFSKVNITLDSNIRQDFKIKHIHIYKENTKGRLVPTAENWNATDRKVTNATQIGNKTTDFGRTYDIIDNIGSQNEIYLFESNNKGSVNNERTCLIIEAEYRDLKQFYRLDFGSFSNNQMHYVDILRNHSYTFNIKSVREGAKSRELAVNSEPINKGINGEVSLVTIDDTSIGYVIFDNTNHLGVTSKEINLINQSSFDFIIDTDVPTGYKIDKSTLPNWLNITNDYQGEKGTYTCQIVVQPGLLNEGTAYFTIKAGKLELKVKVTYKEN